MSDCPNRTPALTCQCYDVEAHCVCSDTEKQVRWWMAGHGSMDSAQREWCLNEIDQSPETMHRSDYEGLTDQEIARGVLDAWRDIARDKGTYV